MKKCWTGLIAAGVLLSCSANVLAAPCVSGTLTAYLGLGSPGCDIGTVTFSDFQLPEVLPDATPIDPGGVSVTPLTSGAPGLAFTLGTAATAGANQLLEILIAFRAAGTSDALFRGNSLALLGDSEVSGDGAITVVEDKCLGGVFASPPTGCSAIPLNLVVFDVEGASDRTESASFSPVAALAAVADLVIDGGPDGSAFLGAGGGTALRFNLTGQVPEPSAISLVTIALLALGSAVMRRRTPPASP
jgi:hypothetical protein